jgi:hypothetical protein
MIPRWLIAAVFCLVATDLCAQMPPKFAPSPDDAPGRRRWREQAVGYVPEARALVETEWGDLAATAILASSKETAQKLVDFHASGALGKIRPKEFLQAVVKSGYPDEVLAWSCQHGDELADPEMFEAFLQSPTEYGYGLKSLSSGVAENRKRLEARAASETPSELPRNWKLWALGAGLIGLIALAWRKR